ncbi:MAG: archaellin/type IV pilin N-terminal domain-containing protein, partial [Desulfurococcaceae archaeon]
MKGISPLVATAILLVVTIAGGVLIYNYVINSLSSAEHFASLNIVSSKMLVLENSTIVNIR